MKYRRRTALAAALCMIVCTSLSASAATYDMDGDRNITVFDLVLKKREMMENPDSYALYDMLMIDSHILGYTLHFFKQMVRSFQRRAYAALGKQRACGARKASH